MANKKPPFVGGPGEGEAPAIPMTRPAAKVAKAPDKAIQDEFLMNIARKLQKDYKGARILSDGEISSDVKCFISTDIPALDKIMGKGVPTGKLIEIFGPESSGKTTLSQHIIAKSTQHGAVTVYIDGESSLDKKRALEMGMDFDKIIYFMPETLEEAFDFINDAIDMITGKDKKKKGDDDDEDDADQAPKSNPPIVVLMDSLASFPTISEMEGDAGDRQVADGARVNAVGFRKLAQKLAAANVALIIINQLRDKINVQYGEKEGTPGGRALKFFASIRLRIHRLETVWDSDDKKTRSAIGIISEVECRKNKLGPPFGKCILPIMFDGDSAAIDVALSAFDYMDAKKMISRTGKEYKIPGIPEIDPFPKKAFSAIYAANIDKIKKLIAES